MAGALPDPLVASNPAVAPSAAAIAMLAASGARRRARAHAGDVVQPESRDGAMVSSAFISARRTPSGGGITGSAIAASSFRGAKGTTIGAGSAVGAGATATTGSNTGSGVTAGGSAAAIFGAAAPADAAVVASWFGSLVL